MQIGQSNIVKFKVNVMGTSTEPNVRVLLNTKPALSFPATKVGDDWVADLDLPTSVTPGKYNLTVEVLVGGRHFTPVTKKVTIDGIPEVEAAPEPEKTHVDPVPEVVAQEEAVAEVEPIVEPVVEPTPEPEVIPDEPPRKVTLPSDLFKSLLGMPTPPVVVPRVPIIPRDPIEPAPRKQVREAKKIPKRVVEIKHELPIQLIKGDIIIE
jgi:hypothetical protein